MNIKWELKSFEDLSKIELYEIMVLRQEVFVVEQDCPYIDADGKDFKSHHLMGRNEEGDLLAYSRIVEPGISYKEVSIGRIVNSGKSRGIGLGKELMKVSFNKVEFLYGKVSIRISAQCYLIPFYEDCGFKAVGKEYLEDDIPHIEMLRT